MTKKSTSLHLPLVILAILVLAFVPILLSLNKKIAQPKAQTCSSDQCSTSTGCQLTGYLMNVNGVDYTCEGNNEWTDPESNLVQGDGNGPVVQPVDQVGPGSVGTSVTSPFTAELVDDPDGNPDMSIIQVTNSQDGSTLTVGDKINKQLYPAVFADPEGLYAGVTYGGLEERGQLTSRTTAVYSLATQEKLLGNLCTTGALPLFWKSFLVFDSCETQENRPWPESFAPSIVAHNLETGEKAYILQSSTTQHYRGIRVEGDTLIATETTTETWDAPDTVTSNEISLNLFDILQ